MKKVVLFLDSPVIATGYASTCRLTAKELARHGYEVYCISFNGGPQNNTMVEWYGIKILPNYALSRDPYAMYGDAQTVVQIFNELNPDILFFHNDSYRYSYISGLPQHILDRCVFWLPFEGDTPDKLGCELFSKCAATRFVTNHALTIHRDILKDKDIGYIPHSIDFDNYFPAPNKAQAKANKQIGIDNKFVVLRVDRHQPRKYWDLTVEAFAKFAKDKDDVFMLAKCNPRDMVMWNEAEKKGVDLEAIATALGVRHKIFFDDYFFSSPAMSQCFYHPADVFLTTTSGEGFGLTPVEAMACGIPIICPNTPVLPEVCGEGAMLCKIKERRWYDPMQVHHNIVDVDDVVSKLEWAYQDWKTGGKKLADIGMKGRDIALTRYSQSVVYDSWNHVFNEISERKDLVSLITVLYNVSDEQINGEDGIQRLKETLEKFVLHPYEWIIIDNNSPAKEATKKWLDKAAAENPRIRPVYLDSNIGFAGACNEGVARSKGSSVIMLNPDSEALDPKKLNLRADFVRMLLDRAASDSYIGIVGMELNRRDDVLPGSIFPYFCNVLITRLCLDACKIGEKKWFDEKFWPAYYEDCDFVVRAMGKGFKVVAENVPFWHKSGGCNRHMIEGGSASPHMKALDAEIDVLSKKNPNMADFPRKKAELQSKGMQSLIQGNIDYLQSKWGYEARQKIKIVWNTHIGSSVGFSQIAEGLVPALHKLGFDMYVNDWSNMANVEDPLMRQIIEKTRKANEDSDDLESAINIVCWLMETYFDVDSDYKVGVSFCESTKVRPQYLQACNSMDRILTFSEFCRSVQKDSNYKSPINVIPPGIHPIFMNYFERPVRDKFTFLAVGVSQERKDTRRLVQAFCEAFPKDASYFPECEPGIDMKPGQVELVVKSNNFGELSWIDREGYSKVANIRAIFTGGTEQAQRKDYTMQEMYDLYTSADCLVHPSHGEGIGMPILEGAATGLPVIFTNWSSPKEYLDESNSYPCSLGPNGTDFSEAYVGAGPAGQNGKWANIHIGHMKHLMRHVIRNRDDAREKGRKAAETIKKHFNWEESARHLIPLIFEWEAERKNKVQTKSFDPLTFEKPKMEAVKKGDRVLIDIVTRDRHGYLCSLITSLLGQTFKEWDILIQCDDGDESMPNDHQIMSLMHRCMHEGHGWRIIRSHRQGPHVAHDRTLQMAKDDPYYKYKLICRIDDDVYIRPNFLEVLFKTYLDDPNSEIAAVSGVYLDPKRSDQEQMAPTGWEGSLDYAGKIDHNFPWPYVCPYPAGTKPRSVEHLYSSFMYRLEAAIAIGGYCRKFSQIGHREESDFSYRFFLGGWKLFINPDAVGFHYCAPGGGIRSHSIIDKQKLADSDNKIYMRRLARWKKRAEMRRLKDAEKATAKLFDQRPQGIMDLMTQKAMTQLQKEEDQKIFEALSAVATKKGKIAVIINGSENITDLRDAAKRLSEYSSDIYVTCQVPEAKVSFSDLPQVKMVATTMDESALLTKQALSEGDHEFIMTVSPTMKFMVDPRTILCGKYDDYVFETYTSYMPGRFNGKAFIQDESVGTVIGPEVKNLCLISRRRMQAKPDMERIYYSDIMVVQDDRLAPIAGNSVMSNSLIRLDEIGKINWTKICTYQFPIGKLPQLRFAEVSSNEKLVSIIIPTAGRKALLKQCLDSIYAHTSTPFEIIIIDNDSSDGTQAMLEKETKIRPNLRSFRQQRNLGYQKAINIGVDKAKGEYILLFNDDAWIQGRETDGRDWIEMYMSELRKDPKLGLIGPHGCDSPALGSHILFFWCVMLRRSLWKEIGPLDDVTFRNYGGDDDYCERVRKAGYSIVERPNYNLRHLMNQVPDHVKKPELEESILKLRAKYKDSNKKTGVDGIIRISNKEGEKEGFIQNEFPKTKSLCEEKFAQAFAELMHIRAKRNPSENDFDFSIIDGNGNKKLDLEVMEIAPEQFMKKGGYEKVPTVMNINTFTDAILSEIDKKNSKYPENLKLALLVYPTDYRFKLSDSDIGVLRTKMLEMKNNKFDAIFYCYFLGEQPSLTDLLLPEKFQGVIQNTYAGKDDTVIRLDPRNATILKGQELDKILESLALSP